MSSGGGNVAANESTRGPKAVVSVESCDEDVNANQEELDKALARIDC